MRAQYCTDNKKTGSNLDLCDDKMCVLCTVLCNLGLPGNSFYNLVLILDVAKCMMLLLLLVTRPNIQSKYMRL